MNSKIRIVISSVSAVLCGVILAFLIVRGFSFPIIVLFSTIMLFFAFGSVPTIYDRVPRYANIGLIIIGIVGVGVLLSGEYLEIAIGAIIIGIANMADLVREVAIDKS